MVAGRIQPAEITIHGVPIGGTQIGEGFSAESRGGQCRCRRVEDRLQGAELLEQRVLLSHCTNSVLGTGHYGPSSFVVHLFLV